MPFHMGRSLKVKIHGIRPGWGNKKGADACAFGTRCMRSCSGDGSPFSRPSIKNMLKQG